MNFDVAEKYGKAYFMPPEVTYDWVKKDAIEKPPIWCSVDLRDGNQALVEPMVVEEKIEMFNMLVQMGFKEIEIGFPAASQIEFDFLRQLVERRLIPDDVTVQVLTQCRDHLLKRTFESIQGIPKAVVHIYNSTSTLQRDVVFNMDREEIKQIAIDGVDMVKKYMADYDGKVILEYSPESFTGTEMDYALDICNAVQRAWGPTPDNKMIINLPSTVEMTTPNVFADQIEWMSKHLENRESIVLSVHPHNDRGTGVAAAELAMLAGADRVEGTLFGNGERTGNVDIVTVAMNMFSQGVDPKLDFSDLPSITEVYEKMTCMKVYDRQPYSGSLVFAAFSGSHQDAIAKGMKWREEKDPEHWTVPYLPIDPMDIGRQYDGDVIRINSQSGKGGIGYLLQQKYGVDLPKKFREKVGYTVKSVSDHQHKELTPDEVYEVFRSNFVNKETALKITEAHYKQENGGITATVTADYKGRTAVYTGSGNGRLDAVSDAIKNGLGLSYSLVTYNEHAIEVGSKSKAAAYVEICDKNGNSFWGAGIHTDIINSSVSALVSAINNSDMVK